MTREKSKRELILESAAVIFARNGFFSAKVEEIAAHAGVGKGTVYEYFASKQELFQELVVHGLEESLREMQRETARCTAAEDKLRIISALHCSHVINYRDLTRVTMDSHCQMEGGFRNWIFEVQARKIAFIRETIEQGIANGEFRSNLDGALAAQAFAGIMASLFHQVVFAGELDEKAMTEQAQKIVDVLLLGMNKS